MSIAYYYSLTQRQLHNVVNGYRRKEDILSRERWQISRKIMFAYMCKYLGSTAKETDILMFPWETDKVFKMSEEEELRGFEEQEKAAAIFAQWDEKKRAKA